MFMTLVFVCSNESVNLFVLFQTVCCDKYYFNKAENLCKPRCMSCSSEKCIAPDKCICDKPCVNGICINDECQCFPNWVLNKDTLTCECKPGYEPDPADPITCIPVCSPPCINSNCTAPNVCLCHNGYKSINSYTCDPKCSNCENGYCTAPEDCRCKDGYSKNSEGKCDPYCSKACTNGTCVAPETCGCDSEYELDKEDKYTCRPVCKTKCVNATCVSPNVCECLPEYEKEDSGSVCRPKCLNCENGECIAPGDCRCHEGYAKSEGVCSPICQDPCVNGACTSPNNCSCNDGYLKNETSPHLCYKPCTNPCRNGTCEDGQCICKRGYALEGDTCVIIEV